MASKLTDNNLRPQFASRFNVKTRVKRQGRWDSREEERKSKKSEVGEGNRNIWEEVTKVETLHCAFDFLTTTVYRHPSYYSSFISIVCLCPNEECAMRQVSIQSRTQLLHSVILSVCPYSEILPTIQQHRWQRKRQKNKEKKEMERKRESRKRVKLDDEKWQDGETKP